jgi:hypothetical protein
MSLLLFEQVPCTKLTGAPLQSQLLLLLLLLLLLTQVPGALPHHLREVACSRVEAALRVGKVASGLLGVLQQADSTA